MPFGFVGFIGRGHVYYAARRSHNVLSVCIPRRYFAWRLAAWATYGVAEFLEKTAGVFNERLSVDIQAGQYFRGIDRNRTPITKWVSLCFMNTICPDFQSVW